MQSIPYIAFVFLPLLFLIGRPKKELFSVAFIIAVFLLMHGRLVTGTAGVSWDTLAWELGLEHVKNVLHSGELPGWNPYFNSGEPLYIYHYAYAYWQWFALSAIDFFIRVKGVVVFNLFLISLYVFYNVGCYLVFRKIFDDYRVALFCFAASLFSMSFVVYTQEHSSLYISVYFPYLVYFFLELMEERARPALMILPALIGMAANMYIPHFVVIAFVVFVISYFVFMDKERWFAPLGKKALGYGAAGVALMLVVVLPVYYVYMKMSLFTSPVKAGFENFMNLDSTVTGHHQEFMAAVNIFSISSLTDGRAVLFSGVMTIALAGVGLALSENRFRWTVLAAGAAVYFISLGRNTFIYIFFHYLPTFGYLRQYVIFEVFVLFFVICLAGMGIEYLLTSKEESKTRDLIITGLVLAAIILIYAGSKFKEMRLEKNPVVSASMYLTAFSITSLSLFLLIQNKTSKSLIFALSTLILIAGSFQWYLGDLKFDAIKQTRDASEFKALNNLTSTDFKYKWSESRVASYKQQLKVLEYNTFEPAIDGVERDFSEPLRYSLLINKRYYDLSRLRYFGYEYFGVEHPKLFITSNIEVVPDDSVIQRMAKGIDGYVSRNTVFVAESDFAKSSPLFADDYGAAIAGTREHGGGINAYHEPGAKNAAAPDDDSYASVMTYSSGKLTANVKSPAGAHLVYLQNYDDDWRAFVNGMQVPIIRVNYNFQAVRLPGGMSVVEFRFESPYKYLLVMQLAASLLTIGIMLYFFVRKS